MSLASRLAFLAVFLLAASPAAPQSQPSPAPPVFAVELELVNLTVVVRDAAGGLVTNLNREHFKIFENGRPQEIQIFARARDPGQDERLALDLGLMMDTSQSMLEVLKLSQHAAVRFLETIPRARDLLTIFFDEEIRISRYDSEHQQGLFARIQALESGGFTALYDAVTVYLSRVQDARGRKVLVLFSDGEDSASSVSQSETLFLVRSSSVTIYPIAVTSLTGVRGLKSMAFLRQLADLSGGRVYTPTSSRQLGDIYDEILQELGAQYVLGFISDDPTRDGRFRKLEVEVSRLGMKVRHRRGYYAPSDLPPE